MRIFRVVVRGRFRGLSDDAMEVLRCELGEHTVFKSAFTKDGTLTYDERIQFFNMRFEIREPEDAEGDVQTRVSETAHRLASEYLERRGFTHGDLKVEPMDMAAMWSDR